MFWMGYVVILKSCVDLISYKSMFREIYMYLVNMSLFFDSNMEKEKNYVNV